MNIQIFGKSKSFDTKKAERYFKERGIKFQSVDLPTKGLSKGELNSVLAAVGDIDISSTRIGTCLSASAFLNSSSSFIVSPLCVLLGVLHDI